MEIATYRAGPGFLLGASPAHLVEWRHALCVARGDDHEPVLLLLRRKDLQRDRGDAVLWDGQRLAAGVTASLALVGDRYVPEFLGLRLPPGFTAADALLFAI